jgi:hypothetical protein
MKTHGEVEILAPSFFTSALGGERPASRPGRFTLGERAPGTSWIGGWVGLRAGMDTVEYRKMCCPFRELNPGRPPTPWLVAIPTELCQLQWVLRKSTKHLRLYSLSEPSYSLGVDLWTVSTKRRSSPKRASHRRDTNQRDDNVK